jgi:hypothetical protein
LNAFNRTVQMPLQFFSVPHPRQEYFYGSI